MNPTLGVAALLLVAAALFHVFVLQPMQERRSALQAELARQAREAARAAPSIAAARELDGLYRAMERPERTPDWLAKLYAAGQASGLGLQSATYRSNAAPGRLELHEVVLPMTGTYAQVREFVARALAEVPLLSLDTLVLRRAQTTDGLLEAEVHMTLHTVRP